jgi:hypothetical protein
MELKEAFRLAAEIIGRLNPIRAIQLWLQSPIDPYKYHDDRGDLFLVMNERTVFDTASIINAAKHAKEHGATLSCKGIALIQAIKDGLFIPPADLDPSDIAPEKTYYLNLSCVNIWMTNDKPDPTQP